MDSAATAAVNMFKKDVFRTGNYSSAYSITALEAIMITTHFVPLRVRRHPPLVSDTPQDAARADWLYNSAEELLRGTSVVSAPHAPSARRDC